ncbi:MAG: RnfABCDGE type electron transport complex subunit D [Clostridiales bacterium]|nr:RnfABCDGE type electron transport complex subunit D [Clostridiales bacterium]
MADFDRIQKPKEYLETRSVMIDYIIMLLAVCVNAVYNYRLKAVLLLAISVATCVMAKKLCEKLFKSEYPPRDFSAVVTGLMIALLLPISATWYMALISAGFAIIVCYLPFGTARSTPFVPAAVTACFLSICWKEKMFAYPNLIYDSYFGVEESGQSIIQMLSQKISIGTNPASIFEILIGQVPSALGTGCGLVLIGVLLYLTVRRPKNSIPAWTFLLAVAGISLLFPRIASGRTTSLLMEVFGGWILFCAVFFMTYPAVQPTRILSKILWGFAGGIICMILRYTSSVEEAAIFGVIIIEALSSLFDALPLLKPEKRAIVQTGETEKTADTIVPQEILDEIPDAPDEDLPEDASPVEEGGANGE